MNRASLTILPGETQNQIVASLDGLGQLMLRAVCKHFRGIIPITYRLLLEAENSAEARFKDLHACFTCLRLRRRMHFADSMQRGRRGKNGSAPETRFCIDCGLDNRYGRPKYTRSDIISVQGVKHVICLKCSKYCLPARPYKAHAKGMALCVACYEPLAETYREEDQRAEVLSIENERLREEMKSFVERLRLTEAGWTESEVENLMD
ncbi:hypothetical protein BKA67DRAFT_533808 [Truncatella angustata]|uniref:F-box domain-containing protein n=1 Tax=Truncatella angustata TaxID=152316 RepID=A0A9P9A387_9PEZI|nr:uncharacterized protein BKA67DRAFT_533808 [Truncatella angustata]KAH6658685.1 hypothetical protein BKA67DRAFT_533808 [Truncatella angustata]